MKPTSAKGEIMSKIRNGLTNSVSQPYQSAEANFQYYHAIEEPLDVTFAERFTALDGKFVFCESPKELMENIEALADHKKWRHLFAWEKNIRDLFIQNNFKKCRIGRGLEKADAGVTSCEALIARTGSILVSSTQCGGRGLSAFPPAHIVLANTSQILPDIADGLKWMREKYPEQMPSMISLISGPSRTADIEKTLVLGAHGPKEVYVFLIDNQV